MIFTRNIANWFLNLFIGNSLEKINTQVPQILNETTEISPKLQRFYVLDADVALYSYYLKLAGVSQDLEFGDIYYLVQDGKTVVRSFEGTADLESYEDFEFRSNAHYVRMVRQEEALNMIMSLGFSSDGFYMSEQFCNLTLANPILAMNFTVAAHNTHSTILKAAYIAFNLISDISESNKTIKSEGLIKFIPKEEQ